MNYNLLFEKIPNLESEYLFTKKIDIIDEKEFVEIYMNPNCFKFTPGSPRKTVDAARNIIGHFERDFNKKRFIFIGLYLRETNKLIGILEVFYIDKKKDEVEIGYRLNENYWNKGYGKLGCKMLIDYLFNIINVKTINATAMTCNIASNKILQSCGFIFQRESIQEIEWKDKGLVDLNVYIKNNTLCI